MPRPMPPTEWEWVAPSYYDLLHHVRFAPMIGTEPLCLAVNAVRVSSAFSDALAAELSIRSNEPMILEPAAYNELIEGWCAKLFTPVRKKLRTGGDPNLASALAVTQYITAGCVLQLSYRSEAQWCYNLHSESGSLGYVATIRGALRLARTYDAFIGMQYNGPVSLDPVYVPWDGIPIPQPISTPCNCTAMCAGL